MSIDIKQSPRGIDLLDAYRRGKALIVSGTDVEILYTDDEVSIRCANLTLQALQAYCQGHDISYEIVRDRGSIWIKVSS